MSEAEMHFVRIQFPTYREKLQCP